MTFKRYRDESRKEYGRELDEGRGITDDQLKIGALLRIADATEKMAQRHTELIRQRDEFERSANYWSRRFHQMERRCRALKGQITKLKKKSDVAS
jgi:hypothetical protein